jgi:hypothetical protein
VPRYFFDIHDGREPHHDEHGTELPGIEHAWREAMAILPEIVRDQPPSEARQSFSCHVLDEWGRPVLKAELTLSAEWAEAAEGSSPPVLLRSGSRDRRRARPQRHASSPGPMPAPLDARLLQLGPGEELMLPETEFRAVFADRSPMEAAKSAAIRVAELSSCRLIFHNRPHEFVSFTKRQSVPRRQHRA